MDNLVFSLVTRGFGWNLMREIFATLDGAVFSLFSAIYQLMYDIVGVTVNESFYQTIQSRIYIILSIYMVFKVTFSILTYVINPEMMTDKTQGVSKLVQRIIISLSLLIIAPFAFEKLNTYQQHILSDNTIHNIILGTDSTAGITGDEIGVAVYDGLAVRPAGTDMSNGQPIGLTKVSDVVDFINEPTDDRNVYRFEYTPLVGLLIGILLSVLILSFCVDLAMRFFKLVILQLIAPIPILSYIDPKSSKDGAFSKWLRLLGSTWALLFVRLMVIDFIVLAIKGFLKTENALNIPSGGIPVRIALIIGLLFFAKDAPKFIYDALGIKQPERGMFAGMGNVLAAGAIAGGAIGAGVSSFRASWASDRTNGRMPHLLKNVGAGLFGAAGGVAVGAGAATNAKDHQSRAVREALAKRNQLELSRGYSGSTLLGRMGSSASAMFTGDTPHDRDQRAIAAMEAKATTGKQLQEYLEDRAVKKNAATGVDVSSNGHNLNTSINDFRTAKSVAEQNGASTFTVTDRQNGSVHTFNTYGSDAAGFEGDLIAAAGEDWARNVNRSSNDGRTLTVYENLFVDTLDAGERRRTNIHNSNEVKGVRKANETSAFEAKNSREAARHKANADRGGGGK